MMGNSILIKLDPEPVKMSCGLFRPDVAHEHVLRTAEVVDAGPGKFIGGTAFREPMDVSPGDGVIFVKFLATHTETAKGIKKYLEEGTAIIQRDDILLVYDRSKPPEFNQ